MVRLLVARGADPALLDGSYRAAPLAWAEHNHQQEVAAYLTTLLP